MSMTIRWAVVEEFDEVRKHYEACGYGGGVDDSDRVAIATAEQLIGSVRICRENGLLVLRRMQVRKEFQRQGIGLAMLKFLKSEMDMVDCYCLPYKHLLNFYGAIGFKEVPKAEAPEFLAMRLDKYASGSEKNITIMQIKNTQPL